MQPVSVTVLGTAISTPIIPDTKQNPFNIGVGVTLAAGTTATYAVEHCFEFAVVMSPTWNGTSNVTWFQNSGLGCSSTGTTLTTLGMNGNYAFPVAAIRLNLMNPGNATTSVTMNLLQAVNSP